MDATPTNPSLMTTEQLRAMLAKRFPQENLNHMQRTQLWTLYENFAMPKEQRQSRGHRSFTTGASQPTPTDAKLPKSRKRTYDMMATTPGTGPHKLIRVSNDNSAGNGSIGGNAANGAAVNGICSGPLKRKLDATPADVSQSQSPTKRHKITWP